MIVPRTRLLVCFAAIALPCATLGAVAPQAAAPAMIVLGAAILAALFDAMLARGRLDGIHAQLPELVRLQKNREGSIDVQIHAENGSVRALRIGLAFPPGIATPQDDLAVELPADAALSRITWKCTPSKRGRYFLDGCHLEATSPLGLWASRAVIPSRAELRVYPNLFDERKNVAALFLNRGGTGIHTHRQTGKGREFEKLREYVSGDSIDDIHWKASAKRGHPVTKIFQIERTQEVYVILDASRLSARRQTGAAGSKTAADPVLERFVTSALVLGMAAEQQGDCYGLAVFDDKVRSFVRARNGKAHFDACREAIYAVQPNIVSPDYDELASFIRLRLRKRALLVFLTALDDPALAESFTRAMDLICRQHLIFVNMPTPSGVAPLFSAGGVENVDDVYRSLGGHLRWHDLRELEKVLERRGVRFNLLDNEKMAAQLVTQYLSVKARQLI